jgi:hypothetical protein
MPQYESIVLSVNTSISPHFEVKDWSIADSFDDFLTEKIGLECVTKFIEDDGKFVARQFYPVAPISIEEMRAVLGRFARTRAGGSS